MEPRPLDELYQDAILEHRRHPRNRRELASPDLSGRAVNPFCGDEVAVQMVLEQGRIAEVGVQAEGCSINQATASMASEAVLGLTLAQADTLRASFASMMKGGELTDEERQNMGELGTLSGVREYPVRIKCALLTWGAIEDTISSH
jgi:nitrogen fixation NifU-like protein